MIKPSKKTFFFFFLFVSLSAKAQNVDSLLREISSKIGLNEGAPSADLYLHIDKTIYTSGENIWFAAYLLNSLTAKQHHTIHFLLIDDVSKKVAAIKNFALENGLGTGCFRIPDSLLTGQYSIAAYTNQFDSEHTPLFRQSISVLGSQNRRIDLQFTASIQLDSITLTGKIITKEVIPPASKISYTIYANGISYQFYQQKLNSSKEIKFNLPAPFNAERLEISGEILKGSEIISFKQGVNWESPSSKITFFPEGGKLIEGHLSTVAFSIKNTSGKAISATCSLLADGKVVSSFTSDLYGRGMFQITPSKKINYEVKVDSENAPPLQHFPVIEQSAWSVHLADGKVNDTLRLQIYNTSSQHQGVIVIHNNRRMLYGAMIVIPKSTGLLKIPVTDWEPGIATVCLFTKEGKLLSERSIMIKSFRQVSALINADSSIYRPLSKANIKVKLRDVNGNPVKGIFSFSCVLDQSVTSNFADIERFNLYDRFLSTPSSLPPWFYAKQEINTEGILLRQNNTSGVNPSLKKFINEVFDGYVLYNGKRTSKPVELMIAASGFQLFKTNNEGKFVIPYQYLRGEAGQRAILSVVSKNPFPYKLVLESPHTKTNDSLAARFISLNPFTNDDLSESQKQLLRNSGAIALKEVVIKANKAGPKGFYGKINDSGQCNDYVCFLGFLNCSSHSYGTRGTKIAVDGETYLIDGAIGTEKIVYHCQYKVAPPYIKSISVVENPSQFYPFSPLDVNPPDALKRTTLHWQAFVETDEKGDGNVSFYTNQLKGSFKAIIQGVSEEGVFSSETLFSVK